MKFSRKDNYYESEYVEYQITNGNHSINLVLYYKVFSIFSINNEYFFKYVAIEKKFGTQTNRLIKCKNNIKIKEQIEMILYDIAENPSLLTAFIGLT